MVILNVQPTRIPLAFLFKALLVFFLFFSDLSFATKIDPTPLNELARQSDYVLVGTVKEVKLFNKNGKEKRWFGLYTGPGIENVLYHYIEIDKNLILKSAGEEVPANYKAKIWNMWHKDLKDEREQYVGNRVVLFLKKPNFAPVSIPEYIHLIYKPEDLIEIQEIITSQDSEDEIKQE